MIVLPLCLAFPPRALLRSFGVAVGGSVIAWLPVVIVDRGTVGAGSYDQADWLGRPWARLHESGAGREGATASP